MTSVWKKSDIVEFLKNQNVREAKKHIADIANLTAEEQDLANCFLHGMVMANKVIECFAR